MLPPLLIGIAVGLLATLADAASTPAPGPVGALVCFALGTVVGWGGVLAADWKQRRNARQRRQRNRRRSA